MWMSFDKLMCPSIVSGVALSIDVDLVSSVDDRDGDTTTRSDKSGGKKRRNWKMRKRIKDGPQCRAAQTRQMSSYGWRPSDR
ncbi:hypothetical protein F2Q68_00039829 [Brassica cretica]|uniref:Uncharacterized protein n=1 Tax=Brassica cretica TaxID=69181 RepID=A0A8S9MDQ6_BRACR|nr:hypothetical protein F2Q68_00039829 [Brassica cretica]